MCTVKKEHCLYRQVPQKPPLQYCTQLLKNDVLVRDAPNKDTLFKNNRNQQHNKLWTYEAISNYSPVSMCQYVCRYLQIFSATYQLYDILIESMSPRPCSALGEQLGNLICHFTLTITVIRCPLSVQECPLMLILAPLYNTSLPDTTTCAASLTHNYLVAAFHL